MTKTARQDVPRIPTPRAAYSSPWCWEWCRDRAKSSTVLYEQRLYCGLAGVDPRISGEFNQRLSTELQPRIDVIEAKHANGVTDTLRSTRT